MWWLFVFPARKEDAATVDLVDDGVDSVEIRILQLNYAELERAVSCGLPESSDKILQEAVGSREQLGVTHIGIDMKVPETHCWIWRVWYIR